MKREKNHEDDVFKIPTLESNFLQRISNTLVQIELQTDMRKSRLSRSSRRVILKASITSVFVLTIAFIVTYSIILTTISNQWPLIRRQDGERSKSGRRTKLTYRPFDVFGPKRVRMFLTDMVVKWTVESYDIPLLEKPECSKQDKIVILISSAPENSNRRQAIRETWCDPKNYNLEDPPWKCIFLIGRTSQRQLDILVEDEASSHQDILIGSYIDSYRNLTIKILHGLYWASSACRAPYVLKTDDDVYVNTKVLSRLVLENTPSTNVYIGLVQQNINKLRVIRNPLNKWHVTFEEFPETHYPPYAVGMGYILSADVAQRVVNISKYFVPFANEDAYVGVLADKLDIQPLRSGRFTLTSYGLSRCNFVYVVVVHQVKSEEQRNLLQRTHEAFRTCSQGEDPEEENSWS